SLQQYQQALADTVIETVVAAYRGLQSVALAVGEVRSHGVAASRRETDDAIDAAVRVLVAQDGSDQPVAILAVLGCHPTVLPPANLRYSRDLFGVAVDAAAQRLGAPVVLCNGAAADVSTRFTRIAQTPAEMMRLGRQLGDSVATAA